jgi:hypothetical protein
MSTTRLFRVLSLIACGGGVLAAAAAGCSGVSATALCQQICDCTGCNATQLEACEAGFNDAETLAADKGCTTENNAYVSCVNGHLQCVGNALDTTACSPQEAALASCTGGVGVGAGGSGPGGPGGPSSVACDEATGGVHLCYLYAGLTAAQVTSVTSACTATTGGTIVSLCSTAGALGVCKETVGGITASITYYGSATLTAAEAQMSCTASGGTWTAD